MLFAATGLSDLAILVVVAVGMAVGNVVGRVVRSWVGGLVRILVFSKVGAIDGAFMFTGNAVGREVFIVGLVEEGRAEEGSCVGWTGDLVGNWVESFTGN